MSDKYWLRKQIESCKKSFKSWPKWMQKAAKFEGVKGHRNE